MGRDVAGIVFGVIALALGCFMVALAVAIRRTRALRFEDRTPTTGRLFGLLGALGVTLGTWSIVAWSVRLS